MKLNARISSEKQSRTVSKSGDEQLHIDLYFKNTKIYSLCLYADKNEDGSYSPVITYADHRT